MYTYLIDDNLNNFKSIVTKEQRSKILDLVESADIVSFLGAELIAEKPNIEDIEGNPKSGYIPLQDGGIRLCALVCNGDSSGNYITKNQQDYLDKLYNDCLDDFRHDYECDNFDPYDIEQDLFDLWMDYRFEYVGSSMYLCFEAYIKGEYVYIRTLLNYENDYYLYKGAEYLQEKTIPLNEFMSMSNDEITCLIKEDIKDYLNI